MAPSKKLGVWLKRRLNPPKKDGSRTVSYTLQWRDEDFEERFKSLGADLTEEEAEIKRAEFDDFLNGDYGDDPQRFVDQMTERRRRGMEKLKLLAGADPRQWPFLKMFGEDASRWYARFNELLKTLRMRPSQDAETLLRQFKLQHPAQHEVLLDTLESEEALQKNVKMLLLFHPGETVWEAMLNHSKVWEWSSEPSRFVEQFSSRYPAEFQKLEQIFPHDFGEDFSLEARLKQAGLPPKEVARGLRDHARGDLDIFADETPSSHRSITIPSEMG